MRAGSAIFGILRALAPTAGAGAATQVSALYQAYWAGMPAGEIRLTLQEDAGTYRDQIEIRTVGLPRLATRFQGAAVSEGRLPAAVATAKPGEPAPVLYDARYDLHKKHDRRLVMRFDARSDGAVVADRGLGDTSKKPPLPAGFRTNVLDPLTALSAIRDELRRGKRAAFSVPVYDGARRFDVNARVLPKRPDDPALHLQLTLAPIAGFKGESSDDGDPDDAPRPVAVSMSDDQRLMPLSMSVSLYYLPLTVQLSRWCAGEGAASCGW
jgi:hypothetical protein